MQPFDRLGSFYLGRDYDLEAGAEVETPVLYDARDLTTHAVCIGMTGSGKTGLCIDLLEEAALDGVPALIIDPKGDITNLLLTFPELLPADFEPWIDPDTARRKGRTLAEQAAATATQWREGLASWGQGPERIRRLREAAEFRIYTPGSEAGIPVSILASLAAPRAGWGADEEASRERVSGTVSALLGLAGVDADPMRDREHILLSTIFEHAWRQGRDLDLGQLITAVATPPVRKLGVFDVDTFFPEKERFALAMSLNAILAAPGFAPWLSGASLDVGTMMHAPDGRPRHCIFSTTHLGDAERMFFTTLLLEQIVAWMRRQPGTGSLRCIVYMDEVYGYLPPTAAPPSKRPLLTLLKQARAFGVGVMLTTQNPVDLDYKALSNAGTWFLGRLQTEQDKNRVLDGLSAASGAVDRAGAAAMLSKLKSRVFLMHNVHQDAPRPMCTRWAMSYLRGPLTREQIRRLKAERSGSGVAAAEPVIPVSTPMAGLAGATPAASSAGVSSAATSSGTAEGYTKAPPAIPSAVPQAYAPVTRSRDDARRDIEAREGRPVEVVGGTLVYEPRLAAFGRVAFVDRRKQIDTERAVALLLEPRDLGATPRWRDARPLEIGPDRLDEEAEPEALFGEPPERLARATKFRSLTKDFKEHLYRDHELPLWHCPPLKLQGRAGESEEEFVGRVRLEAREKRDAEVDKLRAKAERTLDRLEKKLSSEIRDLDENRAEYESRKREELLSAGETLVGMLGLFGGRKRRSGFSAAARKRRMTSSSKMDIAESEAEIAEIEADIEEMKSELKAASAAVGERWDAAVEEIERIAVTPRRADVRADLVALFWEPFWELEWASASGRLVSGRAPAS